MFTTLHRFNRIIFNLIHFNNNLNNQTKIELYKDLHNYTNEIIQNQNSIEARVNKLETTTTLTFLSTDGFNRSVSLLPKKVSFYQ